MVAQKGSISACAPSRQVALETSRPLQRAELQVLRQKNTVLCPRRGALRQHRVPTRTERATGYIDNNHLASGVTQSMEPQLRKLLEEAIQSNGLGHDPARNRTWCVAFRS